jgi:hypothetical protein
MHVCISKHIYHSKDIHHSIHDAHANTARMQISNQYRKKQEIEGTYSCVPPPSPAEVPYALTDTRAIHIHAPSEFFEPVGFACHKNSWRSDAFCLTLCSSIPTKSTSSEYTRIHHCFDSLDQVHERRYWLTQAGMLTGNGSLHGLLCSTFNPLRRHLHGLNFFRFRVLRSLNISHTNDRRICLPVAVTCHQIHAKPDEEVDQHRQHRPCHSACT